MEAELEAGTSESASPRRRPRTEGGEMAWRARRRARGAANGFMVVCFGFCGTGERICEGWNGLYMIL